jgi:hypothetical protein
VKGTGGEITARAVAKHNPTGRLIFASAATGAIRTARTFTTTLRGGQRSITTEFQDDRQGQRKQQHHRLHQRKNTPS